MTDPMYLTPEEVTEGFRGAISTGTLPNWRAMRVGPAFVKIGKSIVYPLADLNEWANQQTVKCLRQINSTGRGMGQRDPSK